MDCSVSWMCTRAIAQLIKFNVVQNDIPSVMSVIRTAVKTVIQWYILLCQVQFNERLYGCSVVGCAATVAPELPVLACHHDGTLTTPCVTPVTSNVTRASHVPCAGELIVLLHTGKWFSVGAVASKFRCYSHLFLDHSFNPFPSFVDI
jgi:hypothetical protein